MTRDLLDMNNIENKFKNSMFGYSKKSVISFIEEMDVQYHEKMKEADKKSDEKISSLKNGIKK